MSLEPDEAQEFYELSAEYFIEKELIPQKPTERVKGRFVAKDIDKIVDRVTRSQGPYFRLFDISPINGKAWGELTGREWGSIGNRGMRMRRLLGDDKTAFDLFGRDDPSADDKLNQVLAGSL